MKRLRVAFLGSGSFGLPTLRRLSAAHDVALVVSQPDRPAGRGRALTPTPIAEWAGANLAGVPLLKPPDVNASHVVAQVHGLAADADAWVVIAFGQKLGRDLLNPRSASGRSPLIVNLHASLLPRWRGAAPINAAILAGDAETGNSVITLADRMDAGLILGQSRRTIDPDWTAGELHDRLADDGPDLVERVLLEHAAGSPRSTVQDESLVTRAAKLSRADAWIDLARPAEDCRRRVHGLTPWPGVSVTIDGRAIKLLRVRAERLAHDASPGSGMLVDPAAGLVACGEGTALRLLEVQPAGGRSMGWAEFSRGRMLPRGAVVRSEVAPC